MIGEMMKFMSKRRVLQMLTCILVLLLSITMLIACDESNSKEGSGRRSNVDNIIYDYLKETEYYDDTLIPKSFIKEVTLEYSMLLEDQDVTILEEEGDNPDLLAVNFTSEDVNVRVKFSIRYFDCHSTIDQYETLRGYTNAGGTITIESEEWFRGRDREFVWSNEVREIATNDDGEKIEIIQNRSTVSTFVNEERCYSDVTKTRTNVNGKHDGNEKYEQYFSIDRSEHRRKRLTEDEYDIFMRRIDLYEEGDSIYEFYLAYEDIFNILK